MDENKKMTEQEIREMDKQEAEKYRPQFFRMTMKALKTRVTFIVLGSALMMSEGLRTYFSQTELSVSPAIYTMVIFSAFIFAIALATEFQLRKFTIS